MAARTVRTGFYATQCEGFRNRVFFFRKPVWAIVRKTTLQKLNQDMFQVRVSHFWSGALPCSVFVEEYHLPTHDVTQPLTETEAALVVSRRDFGFAGLRMLPKKEKAVRLITNMSRRTRSKVVRVKNKSNFSKTSAHVNRLSVNPPSDQAKPAEDDKAHRSDNVTDRSAMGMCSNVGGTPAVGASGTNVQYKRDCPRSINDALIDVFWC